MGPVSVVTAHWRLALSLHRLQLDHAVGALRACVRGAAALALGRAGEHNADARCGDCDGADVCVRVAIDNFGATITGG